MFAPIYYLYLALIDLYMHTYFLNKIIWLVALLFGTNFESYSDLFFGTDGVVANGSNSVANGPNSQILSWRICSWQIATPSSSPVPFSHGVFGTSGARTI